MTKQKEIREGIKMKEPFGLGELPLSACNVASVISKQERIRDEIYQKCFSADLDMETAGWLTDKILAYLHSQGVVIKVKCPDCEWSQFGEEAVGMTPCYSCNSTGYIIELLIEDK